MESKVRKHLYISGHVQGVGFRWYTNQQANNLGITGWVKNLNDGRVEAVLVGDKLKVNKMIDLIKQGSPLSEVEDLEIIDEEFQDEFSKFKVKY
ncbi:acylphosphatase [Orenia metallireducens]|uniref:Acylphosphatase n=1 Tax=Orenia metallireducens TaxID=1413210 RepID=A0A285GQX3_9FIRM|nr:acylphosphatase [Orenia metallireducens]PRX29791.1 acylphosphatase [Orenia metallireducens]SNY24886.1 acylphosphatase [Orenia metallireducens]